MNSEVLKKLLAYDQSSGLFSWRVSRGGSAQAGAVAGSLDSKGYLQIKVAGRLYLAHRLAWLYVYGEFPDGHLDHIDRNPKNNSIANLRICSRSENHQNLGLRATNTSGVTGVAWIKRSERWLAYINVNGARRRLGLFANKADAVAARINAKRDLHRFNPSQPVEGGRR